MVEIPTTMQAMVLTGHGGLDKYEWHEDWPVPTPAPDDVLIRVSACGLNNTDVNTRSGWYSKAVTEATTGDGYDQVNEDDPAWGGSPITFPRIQGADVVGTIVDVGERVEPNLIGKRVITDNWLRDWDDPMDRSKTGYYGSERDGGYAQFTTTHWRNAAVITSSLSDAELATFSCSYSTAEGMLVRANVTSADTVLIPGASGGVGGALVQLAKLRGARIVALASEAKHADVARLKPDVILPRALENPHEALGAEKITVLADVVGGDAFSGLLDLLERGGRYTCSGAIAGPMVELDLRTLYLRDLTFTGSTVIPPEVFTNLVGYIERDEIKSVLAATYPLRQLREAQQAFTDKIYTGNIVVLP